MEIENYIDPSYDALASIHLPLEYNADGWWTGLSFSQPRAGADENWSPGQIS